MPNARGGFRKFLACFGIRDHECRENSQQAAQNEQVTVQQRETDSTNGQQEVIEQSEVAVDVQQLCAAWRDEPIERKIHHSGRDLSIIWAIPRRARDGAVLRATNDVSDHWITWNPFDRDPHIYAFGLRVSNSQSGYLYVSADDDEMKLIESENPPNSATDSDDPRLFRHIALTHFDITAFQHVATETYVAIERNHRRPIHKLILTDNPERAYNWEIG